MSFQGRTIKEIQAAIIQDMLAMGGAPAAPTPVGPPPTMPKLPVGSMEPWPLIDFDPYIYDKEPTEPPCHCCSKMLASYGHEKGCRYMAWKAGKLQ